MSSPPHPRLPNPLRALMSRGAEAPSILPDVDGSRSLVSRLRASLSPSRVTLLRVANAVGHTVHVGRRVVVQGGRTKQGPGLNIGNRVRILDHSRLTIGSTEPTGGITLDDDVEVGFDCLIDGSSGVVIGRGSILKSNCRVLSVIGPYRDTVPAATGPDKGRVQIGKNVLLGANAVVLPGVTIGDESVVAPGTVVDRDVAGFSFIRPRGTPAGPHDNVTAPLDLDDPTPRVVIERLKLEIASLLDGRAPDVIQIEGPLPFGRAKISDYARIVALWNSDRGKDPSSLAPRPCPACTGTNHRHLFDSYDRYPFHVCKDCGTWFVPLRVTDSYIERFFERVPEARAIADRMMSGREEATRASDRERFARYFDMAAIALEGLEEPPRYLDIGCGVGHSVALATERGMVSVGLEINRVALEVAAEHGRRVLHPDQLDPEATFHLISMFETLEHITAPDEVLALAAKRLARNGVLMVTMPNRASWEISVLKQRSFHAFGGFEGVGHINLLDVRSLGRLLERHALRLVFSDGQFSNNILDVFDAILKSDVDGADVIASTQSSFRLPTPAYHLLNAVGPYMSAIDRLTGRSPILLAMACREEDAESFSKTVAKLEAQRRQELASLLG